MKKISFTLLCILLVIKVYSQPYTKSLYVDFFPNAILGIDENSDQIYEREDQLLNYAKDHNFNSLILYGMQKLFPIESERRLSTFGSPPTDFNNLKRFIKKAKDFYGITEIGTTVGANWNDDYEQPNNVKTITYGLQPEPGGVSPILNGHNLITQTAVALPSGFGFVDFDGNPVTNIYISTNGYIELNTNTNCPTCLPKFLPDPRAGRPHNVIAGREGSIFR